MAAPRLRTSFFGSSEFSLPSLRRLAERHDVVAVVSQPDKPAGRGLRLTATPVSAFAHAQGLPLLTPAKLDAAFAASLAELRPEFLACASYGKIVPGAILGIPSLRAALNVHPSVLPHYRGATPIQTVLREGGHATGVTIFWMVQAMDAGDIAASRPVAIDEADNYQTLHDKLARAGADALLECAEALIAGTLPRVPQNENDATYTKPLSKEDLRLDLARPAQAVVNQIRSLAPKPGAWMLFQGKRLKVVEARVAASLPDAAAAPGALLVMEERVFVKTDPGGIELTRLIVEGKAEMSGSQFAQAHR